MDIESGISEKDALKFRADNDARVKAAREGMGYEAESPAEQEEEAPEVETPAETDDTVTGEEETEEEEQAESDDTEEETEPQTRDKSVFRQLNEIRSQKRALEAEKTKLLEDYNKALEENTKLKANQPPPQPFVDFAKKQGISDPKQVVEMYDLFKSNMEADFGTKITALDEKLKTFEEKENQRAETNAYNESMEKLTDEWRQVVPFIEGEYKPTAQQLDEAFALMADLGHEQKYADKELDYILFKEAPKFEEIFGARKRRTMFSARGRTETSTSQRKTYASEHERIMALRKEMKDKQSSADGYNEIREGTELT